jgi:peptidoglycan/LPS O-acetylase OafA/YrhL
MSNSHRSAGIDVLRGICVLLVVLHHIHLRFKFNHFDVDHLLPAPVGRVAFWSGYFSVIAFFVISGFLITSLSLRRWGSLDRIDIEQFYRLRFARIAPCLLALLALLSMLHFVEAKGFVIDPQRSSLGRALVAALTFHVNWLEGHYGYLSGAWDVLWSLSVEEAFYLLFPLVCLWGRQERWLPVLLLALIVIGPVNRVLLAGQDPWADYAYLSCADGLAFGCLAALLASRIRLGTAMLRLMMSIGAAFVVLIVVLRELPLVSVLHEVGIGISVLEMGVAMLLVAISGGIGTAVFAKGTGLIRLVGRSSYEIYLTHMLVLLGLMPLIVRLQPGMSWIAAWHAALLVLSVALGWIVSTVYSEPLNEMLRTRKASSITSTAEASTIETDR